MPWTNVNPGCKIRFLQLSYWLVNNSIFTVIYLPIHPSEQYYSLKFFKNKKNTAAAIAGPTEASRVGLCPAQGHLPQSWGPQIYTGIPSTLLQASSLFQSNSMPQVAQISEVIYPRVPVCSQISQETLFCSVWQLGCVQRFVDCSTPGFSISILKAETSLSQQRSIQSKLCFFQQSFMDVRLGP